MSVTDIQRRKELADFLKTRRSRLSPGQAGLASDAKRRRTTGLRREEVAVLAGISLSWYTAFEQGRDIRVSEQVLESLVRTLKLNADERNHLYSLALQQIPLPTSPPETESIVAELQQIVDQLDPLPAYVHDMRWNVLTWNHTATVIFGDFGKMPAEGRNILWLMFTQPEYRERMPDWAPMTYNIVAQFRNAFGRNIGDPWFQQMIDRLYKASPEFWQWWEQHEVQSQPCGGPSFLGPGENFLSLKANSFALLENPNLVLKVMTPVSEAAHLGRLAAFKDSLYASDRQGH